MGKYNKPKIEVKAPHDKYLRFCPSCRTQTHAWNCLVCGTPTRRVNLTRTIGMSVGGK